MMNGGHRKRRLDADSSNLWVVDNSRWQMTNSERQVVGCRGQLRTGMDNTGTGSRRRKTSNYK